MNIDSIGLPLFVFVFCSFILVKSKTKTEKLNYSHGWVLDKINKKQTNRKKLQNMQIIE